MIFDFDKFRRDTGFRFIAGCWASCEKKLREGFRASERGFMANVSAEHIDPLFRDYIASQTEELFLFLETPCNLEDEELDADGNVVQQHVNVYYWDGITKEEAGAVLDEFGEWLIHDGFTRFGFGIKSFRNEIMKDSYNVISLYSADPAADRPLVERHLLEVPGLRVAWDYFDRQHPGECSLYRRDDRTVHEAVEALLERGLYFAERKEA